MAFSIYEEMGQGEGGTGAMMVWIQLMMSTKVANLRTSRTAKSQHINGTG